jgi:hypothetical protein
MLKTITGAKIIKYSTPPKAGRSGFRMAISRTFFVSGFQMALVAILYRKPDNLSGFRMVGHLFTI